MRRGCVEFDWHLYRIACADFAENPSVGFLQRLAGSRHHAVGDVDLFCCALIDSTQTPEILA